MDGAAHPLQPVHRIKPDGQVPGDGAGREGMGRAWQPDLAVQWLVGDAETCVGGQVQSYSAMMISPVSG